MPAFTSWAFTIWKHHNNWGSRHPIAAYYSFVDPERMKCWVAWLVDLYIRMVYSHKWSPISYKTSRAQDSESTPAKDRRSVAGPGNQPRPRPWLHCVRWAQQPSNFRPMSIVVKQLDGSRCHLFGGRPRPRQHCVRWGPSCPRSIPKRGMQQIPSFRPCLLWSNGRPSQPLLSSC